MNNVTIPTSDGRGNRVDRTAMAHTKGHETVAVHREFYNGAAVGARYSVTHLRTGCLVTAHEFFRLQPARQVARGAHRVLTEAGDFGTSGSGRDDGSGGYAALAKYHAKMRDLQPWTSRTVSDASVDAWVFFALR